VPFGIIGVHKALMECTFDPSDHNQKDFVMAQILGIGLLGLVVLRRKFKDYLVKFTKRRERMNMLMNKRCLFAVIFAFFVSACAHGPSYTAKNEGEAIKTGYQDNRLQELNNQNQALLKEIYARFYAAKADFYKDGLGFTDVTNEKGTRMYYLMVRIRPQEIMYKGNKPNADERFSEVLQKSTPNYMKVMKKSDLNVKYIDGLAFGVYWAVRDVCDTYGGFIEYIEIYTPKQFVDKFLDGSITFQDMLLVSQVLTSLDQRPATSVKPVFK